MRAMLRSSYGRAAALPLVLVLGLTIGLASCGGGGTGWDSYYPWSVGDTGQTPTPTGPANTGSFAGGQQGASNRTPGDPCSETLARKFVTISMRNLARDYVHYFFIAVAFVAVDPTDETAIIPSFDGALFPFGAVCPNDIGLYTQQGYSLIQPGEFRELGDYCITGPALFYFHENGNFRVAAGTDDSGLGSAIAPAQGSLPTFDNFFTSAGAQIPVPDLILFHNPGAGSGASLKVSFPTPNPCSVIVTLGDPPCSRDSFYYVSFNDQMVGSRTLGQGSGRRVPSDIQGTGCECLGVSQGYQILAPTGVRAAAADCNEFFRGGRIDYAFFEDDSTPSFSQLVWRVTDGTGSVAHEFSPLSPLAGER